MHTTKHWKPITLLIFGLFLLRGAINILMLPPLEGSDSVGHLEYLRHLKVHNGAWTPHHMGLSNHAAKLMKYFPSNANLQGFSIAYEHGAKEYQDFFARPDSTLQKLKNEAQEIPFNQASTIWLPNEENWQRKHPPLYYFALNALVNAVNPPTYLGAIHWYRLVSLIMLALSVIIVAIFSLQIDGFETTKSHRLINAFPLLPLLYCAQSMIYVVAARISNDALAYPLNAAAILLLYLILKSDNNRTSLLLSVSCGLTIGIAFWTKTYALAYLPTLLVSGVLFSYFSKKLMYLRNLAIVFGVALLVAYPLIMINLGFSGSIDGATIRQRAIEYGSGDVNPLKTCIYLFFQSFDGYKQFFRMLVTRAWTGNWSNIGNYLPVYLAHAALYACITILLVKRLIKQDRITWLLENKFLVFSVILHVLLFAALVRLGIYLYMRSGEPGNVAGYYAYVFYPTELYIFWKLLAPKRHILVASLIVVLLASDFIGIIAQLLFYYSAGSLGIAKMVVPHPGFLHLLPHNWSLAPWTTVSFPIISFLIIVYFFVASSFAIYILRVHTKKAG
ncbi:MAG: hypothetical protein GF398_07140 [Chitinivibrionales bacterium]|nr:hypothetical protein [Chitinivibrionales bacterium]